ncbi:UDP-3-O-(3-hydroxymyristoyl)glucosamine N-acyltransferase [Thiorhodovibrio frisius]|uniref:UDP-3-O-acylglucosamine N-acyltransferase n=1 Tax=Thiorhodovibrio frisius TaxID=631362 RepID=H8Z812_9GAMM|nr:UDP-3-O-(3-hydroxymyristoyl)glucosamine N-acyltransferase [Thiorhodovibrio frisius]EIC19947.1 UDP-3-O-(3-hydroxymyristoyl) glucosamine N-acyltransferase [Thiorhodovibrio frisius]WPL20676.1 UDP-3-O-acylglucosamine N-acyltransferase [Thiorhodovibrio frisius]
MTIPLAELAERIGAKLMGDGSICVSRVATLERATSDCLTFFGDQKLRDRLSQTSAAAVILKSDDMPECPAEALVSDNPYLTFARAIEVLHPPARLAPGCHPSAVISAGARIDPSASLGPLCVIEQDVEIGPRVQIGPGCIVLAGARIGADSRLVARVVVCENSVIGERALLHPGAVVGREGFGFARDGERWVRMGQIGRAVLGDDVEVGVNSAVDRGAIEDTYIGDGVKIDSLVQIGHNVRVGENTAMAACSGISGSTRIGRNCTLAGAVGMAGHLSIADNVHFSGMAMVTRSVRQSGVYSSGIPAMPAADWRRQVARFRQLDEMARRLKRLEARLAELMPEGSEISDAAGSQGAHE